MFAITVRCLGIAYMTCIMSCMHCRCPPPPTVCHALHMAHVMQAPTYDWLIVAKAKEIASHMIECVAFAVRYNLMFSLHVTCHVHVACNIRCEGPDTSLCMNVTQQGLSIAFAMPCTTLHLSQTFHQGGDSYSGLAHGPDLKGEIVTVV